VGDSGVAPSAGLLGLLLLGDRFLGVVLGGDSLEIELFAGGLDLGREIVLWVLAELADALVDYLDEDCRLVH